MNNNELGEKIRKARGDLSLRDFAKKCGISHTHLDSIEKELCHFCNEYLKMKGEE